MNYPFPQNEWKFDKEKTKIEWGTTSYVFFGTWKNEKCVLKWVDSSQGGKESDNLKKIHSVEKSVDNHIVYPMHIQCGEYSLNDIMCYDNNDIIVHKTAARLNRNHRGPYIHLSKLDSKYLIHGKRTSYIFIFPQMDCNLENAANARANHNLENVLDDMRHALTYLSQLNIKHNTISARDILCKTSDADKKYYLCDFGSITQNHTNFDVEKELEKISWLFG